MKIIMLGPPGAGKGTQARKLSDILKIPHISSGAMFREMYEKKDPLGIKAHDEHWGPPHHRYVPDGDTNLLIQARLNYEDCKNGFILDGYPRTLEQAAFLDGITKIDNAVYIDVIEEILYDRLLSRKECSSCRITYGLHNMPKEKCACGGELRIREDDSPESWSKRSKEYKNKTERLINYYSNKDLLLTISGESSEEEVNKDILFGLGIKN